ncbi:hypothetical protein T484DRAFT_1988183 [Baffinella frigidus]|nr:hypothetical protein T484DRAFT_1988183 [Cryptophyta sp. CCMP2293]
MGESISSFSAAPSSSSNASASADAGDGGAGIVCSWSQPGLKPGRHPKTKPQKSMFKQFSPPSSTRTGIVSSASVPAEQSAVSSLTASQADRLAERLGTLTLIRGSHCARTESCKDTGRVKRFAREKLRPSLRLRRAKRLPPSLSWEHVEHCLDRGGRTHSALIEGGAGEGSNVDASSPGDENEMPSEPRSTITSSSAFSQFGPSRWFRV